MITTRTFEILQPARFFSVDGNPAKYKVLSAGMNNISGDWQYPITYCNDKTPYKVLKGDMRDAEKAGVWDETLTTTNNL